MNIEFNDSLLDRLMLYSDAVQVTNPLGGSKHKLFCIYMTIGKFLIMKQFTLKYNQYATFGRYTLQDEQ